MDSAASRADDAALRSQGGFMHALLERIPALVAYIDIDRRYRLYNKDFRRWFGYRRLQGVRLEQAHPQAELAPYVPLLDKAFAGHRVRFPLEVVRKGERRHFDVQFVPHRSDDNAVEGVVIHALDISERMEAARRMEASERRFRSLAMAWAGIAWYADSRGRMLDAPGWEELTGQGRKRLRGDGWLNAVSPHDRARVRAAWDQARRSQVADVLDLEFRVLTPVGEARYVAFRAVPVVDNRGEVLEWIGSIRDVHEKHLFEQQLRHAEAEQHALLDNLPKMVWIAEPDGSIRYQNRRWYEYAGLSGREDWRDICHPQDLEIGLRSWDRAIREGEPLSVELRFRRASDGEYRWHIVRGQPLLDEHGNLRCWYGASTDIEDQKRALEMLAAANQRVSRFLAVLSHELRNPLSGVAAASELLQRPDLTPAQQEQTLAMLIRQNRHVQRMVEDLLDVSRVTQGDLELRREAMDLGDLLGEVREDNLLRAQTAGVGIAEVRAEPDCWVEGDRARLRQVFDNLLSNAIKASSPGQPIEISVAHAGAADGSACIEVNIVDQGQGLDRDIATKLFEPFVQTPSWRARGLGLGLNIVKTLVERHGGQVSAHSPGLGHGSRFVVSLPASDPVADLPAPAPAADTAAAIELHGRILIVDDETDTAEALATLLSLYGHRVRIAGDAEQALAAWRGEPADVVLCDLELPGPLSGYDVARALRVLAPAPYLIAYSGYGQAHDREQTRAAGFHEHLIKPAAIERIHAAVQRGLGAVSKPG
ncbi:MULTISPECIES: PAS domain-containing protein [Lysobacter]|uniref:PAS domain-containing protein n=1 Tax=Lysobacter TaxID=68 RepID=UPI001F3DCF01|nr:MULTISPECIES: PAS domain-containing protein [Lysobacter]UJB19593.1 PAS domain S-box protein [Lysobacter capsici]UJQ26681.1 PAS domain S-box protein [Lysobacter gummosus]